MIPHTQGEGWQWLNFGEGRKRNATGLLPVLCDEQGYFPLHKKHTHIFTISYKSALSQGLDPAHWHFYLAFVPLGKKQIK